MPIPVTVFTGFLGSGKTTIILNLIKQLPKGYKLVMLKNEFGNVAVDSKLAKTDNVAVTEMLNGCLCCILVGKLGNALEDIMSQFTPDRIIIETSGSAYPAPIAWELKKLGEERLKLDGIVTVIDALNFEGYKDRSYTAKLQAQYTDLILINKHEEVSQEKLDKVLDDVYELNSSTPKIKTDKGKIALDIVFGLDSNLYQKFKKSPEPEYDHYHKEVELMELHSTNKFSKKEFEEFLGILPKWDFYRVKGAIELDGKWQILNYAFGKWEFTKLKEPEQESALIFMGKNFAFHLKKVREALNLKQEELKLLD